MTESNRGEEELENLEGLEEIDVTECAEDNEQLKQKFQDKVCHTLVLLYLKAHKNKPFPDRLR